MKRSLLTITILALIILHQDFWFWRTADPVVFGFIPIGLFYHACYTVAASLVMWMLVKQVWPDHLEEEDAGSGTPQDDFLHKEGEENQAH